MKIICDWENCKNQGLYKAPVEKDNSKKFRLLCLQHIKIFNLSSSALFQRILKKLSVDPKFFVVLCHVISDLIKYSIS